MEKVLEVIRSGFENMFGFNKSDSKYWRVKNMMRQLGYSDVPVEESTEILGDVFRVFLRANESESIRLIELVRKYIPYAKERESEVKPNTLSIYLNILNAFRLNPTTLNDEEKRIMVGNIFHLWGLLGYNHNIGYALANVAEDLVSNKSVNDSTLWFIVNLADDPVDGNYTSNEIHHLSAGSFIDIQWDEDKRRYNNKVIDFNHFDLLLIAALSNGEIGKMTSVLLPYLKFYRNRPFYDYIRKWELFPVYDSIFQGATKEQIGVADELLTILGYENLLVKEEMEPNLEEDFEDDRF
nr:MAG TPA: hypothetical protein [Caudoviricetes sp.]